LRIKGNFLKDYVKTVNDTPELDWNKYLTPGDWETVRSIIIPSQWYPAEVMGRIGRGLFEMRTKSDYSLVRLHGRSRVDTVFDEETKKFLTKGDPIASVQAYVMIARRYIDEVSINLEKAGPGFALVCWYPVDNTPSWDLFREIQAGSMEKLIEMNRGKNPQTRFLSETREGREAGIIHLTWQGQSP